MKLEEKILNLYKNEYKTSKQQRIIDILKVILVDKETNPDKIVDQTATTLITIKKYVYDKELMSQYLTEDEYEIFKQKVDYILNSKEKKEKKTVEIKMLTEEEIVKNIIDDIFNTRHKIEEIYKKNYTRTQRIENLIFKTNYLDENFGLGMKEKVKKRLAETGLIRLRKPRNYILIEDRWDVFVANPDTYYLNEIDFKKLKLASSYLCSGANIDYVINKYNINITTVVSVLSDLKLQEILKPNCYENLKRYVSIEKVLINSDLSVKKTLLFNIIHVLNESNYDKQLTQNYFNIPVCLFDKLLNEIMELPYFDEEVKNNIKILLNVEENKKVK